MHTIQNHTERHRVVMDVVVEPFVGVIGDTRRYLCAKMNVNKHFGNDFYAVYDLPATN